jgi:hypothetical protein
MTQRMFRPITYVVLFWLTLNLVFLPSASGQSSQSKSNDACVASKVPTYCNALFARMNAQYGAERLHIPVEPGLKAEYQNGSAPLYDITPSRVRRDRSYDVSIRERDCQKNELAGARLSVLDSNGLAFSSVERKGCFLYARLAVSKSAELGRTMISIRGTQGLLGQAYLTVEDLESFGLPSPKNDAKEKIVVCKKLVEHSSNRWPHVWYSESCTVWD